MKYLTLLLAIFLFGCSSTEDHRFIRYSTGSESLDAYSENPLLKCQKQPEIARLDKSYDDRVYLIDGESCK